MTGSTASSGGQSRGGDRAETVLRDSRTVPPAPHAGHGNSVAAWTAVGIILIGAAVMSFGVALTTLWIFLVGTALVVVGVVAGKVLSAMGFGAGGGHVSG